MPVPHRRLCRCRMGKPFGAEFNVATVRRQNSLCQIGQTVAGIVNIPKRKSRLTGERGCVRVKRLVERKESGRNSDVGQICGEALTDNLTL